MKCLDPKNTVPLPGSRLDDGPWQIFPRLSFQELIVQLLHQYYLSSPFLEGLIYFFWLLRYQMQMKNLLNALRGTGQRKLCPVRHASGFPHYFLHSQSTRRIKKNALSTCIVLANDLISPYRAAFKHENFYFNFNFYFYYYLVC